MKKIDVVVVGAGVAGLTAGIYLKRSSLSSLLIEKGAPGGKLLNIHAIDNYPTESMISGPELAAKIYSHASSLGVISEYGEVLSIKKENDVFTIKTNADEYQAKAVIIATGIAFKKTTLENEKKFQGAGISYCATCDGRFYKDCPVAVLGGDDASVEEAIYLSGLCSTVYFVYEKKIESTESHLNVLRSKENVVFVEGKALKVAGEVQVEELVLEDGTSYKVEAVFPLNGEKSGADFLYTMGLTMEKGFVVVDRNSQTNIPGVFACGDCVDKKLRQIVTAEGEAATAATGVISFINNLKKY
ncbi:MAG: FAD-dependent oxidoreductase [Bacilli bacterium]|nr:FAD-dependent oxidoreductase [Bacilli bacterium]